MFDHDGVQVHQVVQNDPLDMGALKLDIGVWAHPSGDEPAPGVGSKVFCIHDKEEDRWYWLGCVVSVDIIGIDDWK
jgi:hypothetical protein